MSVEWGLSGAALNAFVQFESFVSSFFVLPVGSRDSNCRSTMYLPMATSFFRKFARRRPWTRRQMLMVMKQARILRDVVAAGEAVRGVWRSRRWKRCAGQSPDAFCLVLYSVAQRKTPLKVSMLVPVGQYRRSAWRYPRVGHDEAKECG
jgi:hypothetical protein